MNRSGIYREYPKGGGGAAVNETTLLAPTVEAANVDEHLPELRFHALYSEANGDTFVERVVIGLSRPGLLSLHKAIGEILAGQVRP